MKNYTYSGWKLNGFIALILNLALVGAAIYAITVLASNEVLIGWALALLIVSILCAIIMMCGYIMLEPNESRVLLFFGNYRGTFYDTGFWWINPFMSAKKLSMRARNLNVDPIKVNDKAGNPILIGLVVVWKIKNDGAYNAVFEIDAPLEIGATGSNTRMNVLENFVAVQSDSALRQVAGMYAYDENSNNASDEVTLRSGGDEIN
ncbi:MAG: SPFH domain-containing protein, partial [Alistipes sp.]|nr:SPFH domain-containing protein [Alistipes sp.]